MSTQAKCTLQRVYLNRQGYDDSGSYWGVGQRLYWFSSENGVYDEHLRADDREHAKELLIKKHGPLRFHR